MNIFRNPEKLAEFLMRKEEPVPDQEAEEFVDAVALWVMDCWILDTRRDGGKTKENDL